MVKKESVPELPRHQGELRQVVHDIGNELDFLSAEVAQMAERLGPVLAAVVPDGQMASYISGTKEDSEMVQLLRDRRDAICGIRHHLFILRERLSI